MLLIRRASESDRTFSEADSKERKDALYIYENYVWLIDSFPLRKRIRSMGAAASALVEFYEENDKEVDKDDVMSALLNHSKWDNEQIESDDDPRERGCSTKDQLGSPPSAFSVTHCTSNKEKLKVE